MKLDDSASIEKSVDLICSFCAFPRHWTCGSGSCKPLSVTRKSGKSYLPYMADDGAGFDTIPGLIISAYDAEVLKRTINDPNWSGYQSGVAQTNVMADIDWG